MKTKRATSSFPRESNRARGVDPMTLKRTLESLATVFADKVLAAIRGASP